MKKGNVQVMELENVGCYVVYEGSFSLAEQVYWAAFNALKIYWRPFSKEWDLTDRRLEAAKKATSAMVRYMLALTDTATWDVLCDVMVEIEKEV